MLRIVKGGKLYYRHEENNRWINVTKNLLVFLTINPNNICEIDNNTTLLDIFNLIKKHKDVLIDILHPSLDEFLTEIRKKPTGMCNDCDYLEIYWNPTNEQDWGLTDASSIHLIKDVKNPTGDFDEDFPDYSIMITPLNEIKRFPVKLNKEYKIMTYDDGDANNITKHKEVLNTYKEFTLIEILSCIMWEITWYGGPSRRNKHVEEWNKDERYE